MGMNIKEAANEAKKLLRGLQGIEAIADAVDQLIAVENDITKGQKALTDLQATLAAEQAKFDKQKAAFDQSLAEASAQVDEYKARAKAEADKVVADAKAKAKRLEDNANNFTAKADERLKLAADEYGQLQANIAAGKAELANVEAKLDAARKQVNKLLGS